MCLFKELLGCISWKLFVLFISAVFIMNGDVSDLGLGTIDLFWASHFDDICIVPNFTPIRTEGLQYFHNFSEFKSKSNPFFCIKLRARRISINKYVYK